VESHRRAIAVLDAARDLGIRVGVRDDSGYWEHRDEHRLVRAVEKWNSIVAKVAGGMVDRGDVAGLSNAGLKVEAPIFHHPQFEHLESED